jgi:nicotinate-nucleotide adenylyltransferase
VTRPRRIGLYGGSFDPIHFGHLRPVEETRVKLGIDEVLYVPAFVPPHKPVGPSASSHHRFAMAALALTDCSAFRLSDFEVSRGGTTYTIETLRHMRAVNEGSEIVLVLGSDALLGFESWRSWREVAEGHRFAVLFREPVDYAHLTANLAPDLKARLAPEGATLDDAPEGATILWGGNAPVTISSTWLRRAIPAGENLSGSLPANVETYARRQRLYLTP